jgi:hypothetical protein
MFRFRLINAAGDDIGPFMSSEPDWKPGHRIQRGPGDALLVVQVVAAEDDVDFDAWLVVESAA